ncbi:hypothetical protein I5Q31_05640 [Serratia marcescens]|nr:hypothetical protein [Serratia marcescens]MBH2766650.1 hypothetical protein [Serratia marcescens]MBH2766710.1 hypothetical protein [Serratia marcescens]
MDSMVTPLPAPVVPVSVTPTVTPTEGASGENGALARCQNDLNSLKQVNNKAWVARKQQFDRLVSGASVYTNVRAEVNGKTRDTLDALYRYKTNQLCAQIERDVMVNLIARGESIR